MVPKYIKVPCGGWIREKEASAHRERCEMCGAMLDYNQEKFNQIVQPILIIFFVILFSFIGWLIYQAKNM